MLACVTVVRVRCRQHMERGLLWLLWAGVVVKARQHFALQEAVAKSERAYALLMAEEEAAVSVCARVCVCVCVRTCART